MRDIQQESIAIIGIGCRLPGANTPQAFWQLLRTGQSAIREVPPERWQMDALYDPDPTYPGKTMCRWGGFLEQVDGFDWRQFRIPPREAKYVDPQHRLLLEVAWEALEDAGLPLSHVAGSSTSVTIGISWHDYLRMQSRRWSQLDGYSLVGNPSSFAANRISYFFNLHGPSLSVDAGCTSSLASLHLACQYLLTGEATLALAGGVNLMLSPESMIMMSKAGLLSPEGVCKALDAEANGCVRGEGAGIVVLKRLSDVRPQERVYAVIRGITLNHNGHNEWIMGTSAAAQERLLREAYARAGVDPAEVDYVELHGTGFLRGDPVETRALGTVLGAGNMRMRPCSIGSLKTNMGNLESASGIASVIKVALSLYHQEIPPTLNLQIVNPAIPLEELHLTPQRTLGQWPQKAGIPLAAVNTLSFTGANGHAILASGPGRVMPSAELESPPGEYVLPLSAGSKEAFAAHIAHWHDFLRSTEALTLPWQDICYTASACRTHHPNRLAVMSCSAQECAAVLDDFIQGRSSPALTVAPLEALPEQRGAPVFLFANQSEQWLIMEDASLWDEPAFRAAVEACDRTFSTYTGRSLYEELRDHASYSHAGKVFMKPAAVFTIQVALAALWRSWGIQPGAVLGEGWGELAAAYVAGMLTLEDAMRLVAFHDEERQTREDLEKELCRLHILSAALPFYSTAVGCITADRLSVHWRERGWHPDLAVEACDQLIGDGYQVFVELGFPSVLSGAIFARLHHQGCEGTIVPSCHQSWETRTALLSTLCTLYTLGYTIHWPALYREQRLVVSLPTYPWQRERLWLDWLDMQEISTSPDQQREALIKQAPDSLQAAQTEQGLFLAMLEQAAPGNRAELLRAHITNQVVAILEIDSSCSPEPGQQLFALGIDSLTATQLMNRLQHSLQQPFSAAVVFNHPTIESLTDYLMRKIFPVKQPALSPDQVPSEVHTTKALWQIEELSEAEAEAALLEKLASIERLPF